jgi:hypothetical protein
VPPLTTRPRLSRRKLFTRLGLGAVGLTVGALLVSGLREATLSTHDEPIMPGSTSELVIDARSHQTERGQTLDEMVEAQVLSCRLEVSSDVDGEIEGDGDGRFRATLTPSLDETNRRQLRGCLEDWVVDGVLLDVVTLTGADDDESDEDEADDEDEAEVDDD